MLSLIEEKNKKKKVYDKYALHKCLTARLEWAKGNGFATEIQEKSSVGIRIKTKNQINSKKKIKTIQASCSVAPKRCYIFYKKFAGIYLGQRGAYQGFCCQLKQ